MKQSYLLIIHLISLSFNIVASALPILSLASRSFLSVAAIDLLAMIRPAVDHLVLGITYNIGIAEKPSGL